MLLTYSPRIECGIIAVPYYEIAIIPTTPRFIERRIIAVPYYEIAIIPTTPRSIPADHDLDGVASVPASYYARGSTERFIKRRIIAVYRLDFMNR